MELQAQHEHLTTPCRLLATLVLPEITSEVNDTLRKHAKGTKQWGSRDIVSFLGDCMQCFFLNASDDWNRSDTIVREFCHEYEVDEQGRTRLVQLFIGLQQIVIREVPTKMEENDGAMQKVNAILERLASRLLPIPGCLTQISLVVIVVLFILSVCCNCLPGSLQQRKGIIIDISTQN